MRWVYSLRVTAEARWANRSPRSRLAVDVEGQPVVAADIRGGTGHGGRGTGCDGKGMPGHGDGTVFLAGDCLDLHRADPIDGQPESFARADRFAIARLDISGCVVSGLDAVRTADESTRDPEDWARRPWPANWRRGSCRPAGRCLPGPHALRAPDPLAEWRAGRSALLFFSSSNANSYAMLNPLTVPRLFALWLP